jgi:hypothetical protein
MLMVVNFGEKQDASVKIDTQKLGWGNAAFTVTDAEAGYKHQINRRVKKTAEELAAEKERFEKAEAAKAAKNPKYKVRPYKENPWRNERVIAWDGDKNAPVQVKGTKLTVPVERHNFRLLVVEKN